MRKLNSTASLLNAKGVEVIVISKDLFIPEAAQELYDEVLRRGILVDILINDAGQGVYGKFIENDLERALSIIQLNIISLNVVPTG